MFHKLNIIFSTSADKAGDFLEWIYRKDEIYAYVSVMSWFDIGNLEQLKRARVVFNG